MEDITQSKSKHMSQAAFNEYIQHQRNSTSVVALLILGNLLCNIIIFQDYSLITGLISGKSMTGDLYSWFSLLIRLAAFVILWITCKTNFSNNNPRTIANSIVQTIFPVIMSIIIAENILRNIYSEKSSPGFSLEASMQGLRVYPLAICQLSQYFNLRGIAVAWLVGVFTTAIVCFKLQSMDQFYTLIIYITASIIVLSTVHQQDVAQYLLGIKLKDIEKQKEKDETEHRAEELRSMIGNVAHDLKTPLTSFMSGLECMKLIIDAWGPLLQSSTQTDFLVQAAERLASLRACLTSMESTNSFMAMTINRCIDYTKASKGIVLVPKYETINLPMKLEMPVRLLRDCQPSSDLRIQPPSPSICPHIITDRQWLLENILCLLSNALKFSNGKSVELRVHLNNCDASEEQNMGTRQYLRFEVLDRGIGLSEEAMKTLFNPFRQAQRLAGGTGLGLFSLSKRVEALHGHYGVGKRPDDRQGCLFWFTIPYRPDESGAVLTSPTSSPPNRLAQDSLPSFPYIIEGAGVEQTEPKEVPTRVLIVDDAPLVLKMTIRLLRCKGYTHIDKAVNGAEALEKLLYGYIGHTEPPYDMVLMDLQMPVMDGIEAIKRLRAQERDWQQRLQSTETAPNTAAYHQFVIAVSANADNEIRQDALNAGADAFIAKPFTYETLEAAMAERA